jgi:hypothetical protein
MEEWNRLIRLSVKLNSGRRFCKDPHTFAPRVFIRAGLWRIPEPEEETAINEMKTRGLWSLTTLLERNSQMVVSMNTRLGLPEPFPSSPTRPPKFGLTAANHHFTFCQLYALHKFVAVLLEGRTYKWLDERTILTDDGIRLKGDLELALEYQPKGKETEWEIPTPYHEQICRIRGVLPDQPPPQPETTPKSKSERKPRAAPEGDLVTLAQLAEELRKKPADLRKKLRSAQEEKPAHGWAWPAEDLEKIRRLLSCE